MSKNLTRKQVQHTHDNMMLDVWTGGLWMTRQALVDCLDINLFTQGTQVTVLRHVIIPQAYASGPASGT